MQTSAKLLSENGDFLLFVALIFAVMLVLRWFVQRGTTDKPLPDSIPLKIQFPISGHQTVRRRF